MAFDLSTATTDDFLRALDDHPAFLQAVQHKVFNRELLELPHRLAETTDQVHQLAESTRTFIEEQRDINRRLDATIEELQQSNQEQQQFNQEQQQFNQEQQQFNQEQREASQEHRQFIQELREANQKQQQFNQEQREASQEHRQFIQELREASQEHRQFIQELREATQELRKANQKHRQFNQEQREASQEHRQFIQELRKDTQELRKDMQELRKDMQELRKDMQELRKDMQELRKDTQELRKDIRRLDTSIGELKGKRVESVIKRHFVDIPEAMGYDCTKIVYREDRAKMMREHAARDMPDGVRRSFYLADLVLKVQDQEGAVHYIAVEASYTADQRDTDRALRNAALLQRFTGCPSHAVIASLRNDRDLDPLIASGAVFWYQMTPDHLQEE